MAGVTKISLKVGDTIWAMRSYRNSSTNFDDAVAFTVAKVGRRWVDALERDGQFRREARFDLADNLEGDRWPGRAYLSREDYEAAQRKREADSRAMDAWGRLKKTVADTYHRPDRLSAEDIEKIIATITGGGK